MPEPVFFRLRDEFAPTSGSELNEPLPTFPLSFLQIAVRRQQPTANAQLTLADMVGFISRIAVYVRGASVFDATGQDAFVIGSLLYGRQVPFIKRPLSATTNQHIANIFIPFSRKPLMPTSGIKQVRRGESLLYMRFGTVPANTFVSIGVVGWRENDPEWTVRVASYTQAVGATGPVDMLLSPAGPILGLIFYEDNPKETVTTTIMGEIKFLLQGVEDTLVSYDLNLLAGMRALTTYADIDVMEHVHIENTATSYTQNATTLNAQPAALDLQRYFPLLLDELYDPDAIIAVPPGMDTRLRFNATRTGTIKVITCEMFTIPERPAEAA